MVLELSKIGAIKELLFIIGPLDPDEARKKAPDSIRAQYGIDKERNVIYGSISPTTVDIELNFFFPR